MTYRGSGSISTDDTTSTDDLSVFEEHVNAMTGIIIPLRVNCSVGSQYIDSAFTQLLFQDFICDKLRDDESHGIPCVSGKSVEFSHCDKCGTGPEIHRGDPCSSIYQRLRTSYTV